MPNKERRARIKRAKKTIASAVEAGGQINISKASTGTVETIAKSKTSKQRGKAKGELVRRAVKGTYR